MRVLLLFLAILIEVLPSFAGDFTFEIHSPRPFGYFVGDVIVSHVDVRAPAHLSLSSASLPHPGPLSGSLDLRDVGVESTAEDGGNVWRIFLTYQNFYVALDVRDIEIPSFSLAFRTPTGQRTLDIPSWRVAVAPLRAIAPQHMEQAEDYLRPDGDASFLAEAVPRYLTYLFTAFALVGLAYTARDRAWPPFQLRKERRFSSLARRIAAGARGPIDRETIQNAVRDVHQALDAAHGGILMEADLPAFLGVNRRPASLEAQLREFFNVSRDTFFSQNSGARLDAPQMTTILQLVHSLAKMERER